MGYIDFLYEWNWADERALSIAFLNVQPELNPLRADPRFDALLHRAGLKR